MIRLALAFAAAVCVAAPALAGPFDGTWKADMSTWKASTKPYTRLLANGHYHCTCSVPPEDFTADGAFHHVAGHAYYDEAAATVVDAQTVHFAYKMKGKQNFELTLTIAGDGRTAHEKWSDTSAPKATTGEDDVIRIGAAPKGAHAVSGIWRDSDKASVSDTGTTVTITQTGQTVVVKQSDGTEYTAVAGGPFVPIHGSGLGTLVAVAFHGPNTLVQSFKRGGKVVARGTWTITPDGKTARAVFDDVLSGRTSSVTTIKQPA